MSPNKDILRLVRQKPIVVWLCGLSGAGKTTLAEATKLRLLQHNHIATVLDGDELRKGINADLGFSDSDRLENMRRTAEVASLLRDAGVVVIVSLISPLKIGREKARIIIGAKDFMEVYVNCPLTIAQKRDTKGLYKKAAEGKLTGLTGVDAVFEAPENPVLELRTDQLNSEECTDILTSRILDEIQLH